MTFFVDNNLSTELAAGMKSFGERVEHLQDHFDPGLEDKEWLPEIGRRGWIVITLDKRMRYRRDERTAITEHSLGVFVLGGNNRTKCERIQQLVRNWPQIKSLSIATARPFAFRVPSAGDEFRELSSDWRASGWDG